MEFRILGPLEVAEGGRQVRFGGPRERALLALLLIHAGEVVSADRLVDGLWGSGLPANPANALQVVVSRVRRALPNGRLVTRRPGYLLAVDPDEDEVDARRFGRLVQEAGQLAPEQLSRRSALLAQALGLWRGPALADFAHEDFAREEVARLEEARMRAVEMRMDAELALGRHAELISELAALVAGHALRERLRGQLMLALYRSGRQGEALRAFQEGRRALARELGADPGPELRELHQRILLQTPDLAVAPQTGPERAASRSNLPAPVTGFVGRSPELQEVRRLLTRSRLATLTGPGGCGKTRLALEAARALLESYQDGVRLVELDALNDPAALPQALAAGVGIGERGSLGVSGESPRSVTDKLLDYLRGKELLVVLDNCEHLIEPCAQIVGQVLRSAPAVRFLATSRERLGVDGEALLPVPALGLPSAGETSSRQLAQSDAVRLFADRATAVRAEFVLDDETGPAVGRICRRLDGIPLALELAAAQVRLLPPAQIAARLDDRLSLLDAGSRRAPPRHRTLQAAVDWSYGLLSEQERRLFARLSVFAGGFTLEAAEAVCGDGDGGDDRGGDGGAAQADVLELLSRLVDQSLVVAGGARDARFRMLETLRSFAADRLALSGTAERLRRRHAEYLLGLAERAEPLLRGPQQAVWLRRLQADHDNFTAAIDWALTAEPELAARLSSALAYFWLIGRNRSEVRRRLAEAVEAARDASPGSRARTLIWAAQLASVEGRPDQAAAQARAAHELAEQVGDPWWVALSGTVLGLALGMRGETGRADGLLDAARESFAGCGDAWGTALATMFLGLVASVTPDQERAAALARRSLEGFRSAGDLWGQTMALELLGLLARRRGAFEDAVASYEEAIGVVRDLGLYDEVPFLLVELGDLQVLRGDFEAAAIMHKQALDSAQERGAADAASFARNALAQAARREGDYRRARELHQAALSFYREAGFTADAARSLACLGHVEELCGDLAAAAACHRESLRLARAVPDESVLATALEGLACVAAARQQPERAAAILGSAEAVRSRTATPRAPHEQADCERATNAALSALGDELLAEVIDRGRHMSVQDAVAYEPSGDSVA